MHHYWTELQTKRPRLAPKKVLFHQDNAPAYTSPHKKNESRRDFSRQRVSPRVSDWIVCMTPGETLSETRFSTRVRNRNDKNTRNGLRIDSSSTLFSRLGSVRLLPVPQFNDLARWEEILVQ